MTWIKPVKDVISIFFITLLLLILLSTLSIVIEKSYYSYMTPSYENSSEERRKNYKHMDKADVDNLLHATWTAGYEYVEVLGFREKSQTTKFVNVNNLGFRSSRKTKDFYSDLEGAVWFLGGSTTFGYGVTDRETIPAYLEELLRTPVVNLGRGYYFSEQENLLLLKLLKFNRRPSKVIFLDGLNERCAIDTYQNEMKALFADQQTQGLTSYFLGIVKPSLRLMVKVVEKIGETKTSSQKNNEKINSINCYDESDRPVPLKSVLGNNLRHRKAICSEYDLDCTTFVQPVAGLHGEHVEVNDNKGFFVTLGNKFDHLKTTFKSNGAVFITSALDGHRNHAFVDSVHHSAAANLEIAKSIATNLADE